MEHIHDISKIVYSEPASKELRPHVVLYVRYYINKAKGLSQDELLHGEGSDYASNICGALAWQGAKDTETDVWIADWANRGNKPEGSDASEDRGWITKKDEPVLWKILEVASPLDIDSNNIDKWHELFDLVDQL